ncbi:MAG: hypothetical protein R3B06_02850 [Kofleriaceae bacterium]
MNDRRTPTPSRPPTPVDQAGLAAAVRLFGERFVVAAKRKQVEQRLATAARRGETLATLPRWLAGVPTPLVGADQSPAGIAARFGDMPGVVIEGTGARRVGIADAVVRLRDELALWIADTGRVALIARAAAPPLLVLRM